MRGYGGWAGCVGGGGGELRICEHTCGPPLRRPPSQHPPPQSRQRSGVPQTPGDQHPRAKTKGGWAAAPTLVGNRALGTHLLKPGKRLRQELGHQAQGTGVVLHRLLGQRLVVVGLDLQHPQTRPGWRSAPTSQTRRRSAKKDRPCCTHTKPRPPHTPRTRPRPQRPGPALACCPHRRS